MTYFQDRLTALEPIVGALVELQQNEHGWSLTIRHRHNAGRYGDCEVEHYECLQLAELFDVMDATIHQLGHGA